MSKEVLIGVLVTVLSSIILGALGWSRGIGRNSLDRRRVYQWLLLNTRDEPGTSHVDITTLAKGTRLPEDRVRQACLTHRRIYRREREPEQWSAWREEPQSVYEKRGLLKL